MSIRTTVTLDEDVLERVKEASRSRGISFRETLNELIRIGLLSKSEKRTRELKIVPIHMGFRPGLNYDSVEALLEYAEGERHR